MSAQNTSLSWWQPNGEFVVGTFGRQALGIIWDFAEIRPTTGASGDFDGALDWIERVIREAIDNDCKVGQTALASATEHPLPNSSTDLFFTDPPYYDAVPYADLSDFFYVQLRRMLYEDYPTFFKDELTPKEEEVVQLAERNTKYAFKTQEYFEEGMRKSLSEGKRLLRPHGIGTVVFAHKTTRGWEAMLTSLIKAGWVATASWPIDTERSVRIRAQRSAALASSIHLVCRPRTEKNPGDWREVLAELPGRIHEWMKRLADEKVAGADAIFACLGPALEIYSRYPYVEKASGERVELKDYLEYVWGAVAKEALGTIFKGADASGFEPDARLTAMWLWTLFTGKNGNGKSLRTEEDEDDADETSSKGPKLTGYALEYDAARKIAQGLGVYLEQLPSVVTIKGETAVLLSVEERAKHLFGTQDLSTAAPKRHPRGKQIRMDFMAELEKAEAQQGGWGDGKSLEAGKTMLDRVHQSMLLFAAGRSEALKRFLVDEGIGRDSRFWKLAQALSALYPKETNEKRWVDGVLAKKKGLGL